MIRLVLFLSMYSGINDSCEIVSTSLTGFSVAEILEDSAGLIWHVAQLITTPWAENHFIWLEQVRISTHKGVIPIVSHHQRELSIFPYILTPTHNSAICARTTTFLSA
jgi:hypothetical protein